VALSDPEFAHESRVSAITVTALDARGDVLRSERIEFGSSPYLPTFEMLLAVRDKLNAQLGQ
jgi:hypothetical protein